MAVGVYFFKFSNNFTFGGITGLAENLAHNTLMKTAVSSLKKEENEMHKYLPITDVYAREILD